MVTVHRAAGLRIMLFVDDHAAAHVHVFGDGQAKIDLLGPSGAPELVWTVSMRRAEARRALKMVAEHQTTLPARWRQIHG